MQDLPHNTDLLDAVTGFLKDDVLPGAEPAVAFRARVAINVLGMVTRHLQQNPVPGDPREREALQALTGKKGTMAGLTTELCRRIADHSIDPGNPLLRDYLWHTTLAKVAVDQPRYSGYRRAQEQWQVFQYLASGNRHDS